MSSFLRTGMLWHLKMSKFFFVDSMGNLWHPCWQPFDIWCQSSCQKGCQRCQRFLSNDLTEWAFWHSRYWHPKGLPFNGLYSIISGICIICKGRVVQKNQKCLDFFSNIFSHYFCCKLPKKNFSSIRVDLGVPQEPYFFKKSTNWG